MAFVDELIHNSKELTVVMMDKRAKPGGSLWAKIQDVYHFVQCITQMGLVRLMDISRQKGIRGVECNTCLVSVNYFYIVGCKRFLTTLKFEIDFQIVFLSVFRWFQVVSWWFQVVFRLFLGVFQVFNRHFLPGDLLDFFLVVCRLSLSGFQVVTGTMHMTLSGSTSLPLFTESTQSKEKTLSESR